jgi:lysophospholipase L1-like esterase
MPGETVWSDPVRLEYVQEHRAFLRGQKLAISFHVEGPSGPITWHAKALTTSYASAPGAGSLGALEEEAAFPFSVTSWFFLDAVDMKMPQETTAIVAFGDSITDGDGATLNGDDRWPDVLSRRLHRRYDDQFAVVNAGIAGNQIAGPLDYSPAKPVPGGPPAIWRLDRDVLSLSGVSAVIWLEGTNDLSGHNFSSMDAVTGTLGNAIGLIRSRLPQAKIIGATLTSARGSSDPAYGSAEFESRRRTLNSYLRTSGLFDFIIDFNSATADPASGELRPEMVFSTTAGGPGDKLHPNRLGYLSMGAAADTHLMTLAERAEDSRRYFSVAHPGVYRPHM